MPFDCKIQITLPRYLALAFFYTVADLTSLKSKFSQNSSEPCLRTSSGRAAQWTSGFFLKNFHTSLISGQNNCGTIAVLEYNVDII